MTTAAMTAGGLLLGLTATVQADIVVAISKSQQRLAVTVDGRELYRWPVSTGRRGLETPSGKFRPVRLERKWFSRKYDGSPMPYSVFFYKGYAVHGSYEVKRLGHPASHGCVRLKPDNASILFNLVRGQGKNDTRIVVTNGPLPAPEPIGQPPKLAPEPELLPVQLKPRFDPKAGVAANAPPDEPRHDDGKAQRKIDARFMAKTKVTRHRTESHFAETGDEASVLRGRQAWLRSLDRKYGIVR